ncbi:MAG: hypothetical protein ACXVZV_00825 [Terriglobales bacterium]
MGEWPMQEEFEKFCEALNQGAPVASVDSEKLKASWRAFVKARERRAESKATGLGAMAGAGFQTEVNHSELFSLMVRSLLLMALQERGVLKQFEVNGELSDTVVRVVAAIPMNKDDLGEALMRVELVNKSPEELPALKAKWLADGFDMDQAKVDEKFLAAVREAEGSK